MANTAPPTPTPTTTAVVTVSDNRDSNQTRALPERTLLISIV
ncbi:hypothetical protein [Actinokineospora globicatena]|nr:hypothetical protein [Actinokineospora globicatena]